MSARSAWSILFAQPRHAIAADTIYELENLLLATAETNKKNSSQGFVVCFSWCVYMYIVCATREHQSAIKCTRTSCDAKKNMEPSA